MSSSVMTTSKLVITDNESGNKSAESYMECSRDPLELIQQCHGGRKTYGTGDHSIEYRRVPLED
jgi:hypothetical protein